MKLRNSWISANISTGRKDASPAAGIAAASGSRKEKNGLLHVYIATETGVDSVHRLRPLPLTPNSELQTLANQGPWVLSWDAGRAGRLPPDWKVIHKIVELGVALNLDS